MLVPILIQKKWLRTRFHFTREVLLGRKVARTAKNREENTITVPIDTKKSRLKTLLHPRNLLFVFFTTCSIALLAILFLPTAYYTLFPADPIPVKTDLKGTPLGGSFTASASARPKIALPPYDPSLPDGNWVIIPHIGVQSEIYEGPTSEEPLSKGVWRVPNFGVPGDTTKPMILAAHRFGYKWWWKSDYWRYHSFYLLPELVPGDLVEVISQHRKYIYEVYAGEEGEAITDYNADLILYTCKFLVSQIRHFRYARLINPNTNTQQVGQTMPGTPVATTSATSS